MPIPESPDNDSANVDRRRRRMSNQRRQRTVLEGSTSSSTRKGKAKVEDDDEETKRKRTESRAFNAGLCCPICIEPWTSQGLHQVCCLPCGHVYGISCISRWIQQCGKKSKCPQCNVPCRQKDIRKIYASPVYVVDEDVQKNNGSLKAEVISHRVEKVGPASAEVGSHRVEGNNTKHASVGQAEVDFVDSTSRLETVRGIDAGMLTFMHVFMAVLSLLICAAVYISLRHSVWMFLVTILMFLVAVLMFLVDEFLN